VAVPLLASSELIGVLVAYNQQDERDFDADDQRLLAIIASQ
jgi:GAF domain-containing protein